MSWRHSLCSGCYEEREPGRRPVRVREAAVETCCACGKKHSSGIYYRADPSGLRCEGVHDDETGEIQSLVEAHNSIKEEK